MTIKANKGRSVGVLDRTEYTKKTESIISDETIFKLLDNDPTITQEDCLIRRLHDLKVCQLILKQEYNFFIP